MILWSEETNLWLFTPEEYSHLPDGFELESIIGKKYIKGKDYIDQNTRFGHLAFGVRSPRSHPDADTILKVMLSV